MNKFYTTNIYKKYTAASLHGMYVVVPSLAYFYDSKTGLLDAGEDSTLIVNGDITEDQVRNILTSNSTVSYSDINFVGGDVRGFSDVVLYIEGNNKYLDNHLLPQTTTREEMKFQYVVLLCDVYETTPPNVDKTLVRKGVPMGILELHEPITLKVVEAGLYGGNTAWSVRLGIEYDRKGHQNTGSIEQKNHDFSTFHNIIRDLGSMINKYNDMNNSYQNYVNYIKEIGGRFTRGREINVPYVRGGKWFVNGKPVIDYSEAGIGGGSGGDITRVYQELMDKIAQEKVRTNQELTTLKNTVEGIVRNNNLTDAEKREILDGIRILQENNTQQNRIIQEQNTRLEQLVQEKDRMMRMLGENERKIITLEGSMERIRQELLTEINKKQDKP
jgi:hypothetical protein